MSKRAQLAANALQRAIDEGTAQLQVELAAEKAEVARLKDLLGRIAQMAQVNGTVVALPLAAAIPPVAPVPKEKLPVELQAMMAAPVEEAPLEEGDLAGADNMGPGRWI